MTLDSILAGPPFNPPPYLSPSSMSTYRQCPQKFKFNKIDGIPDKPSQATLLGNFVHEILETFYVLAPAERTIFAVKSIANEVWNASEWEKRIEGYVSPESHRSFRWSAWWCIENLWKVENPEFVSPLGIEHEVNGFLGDARVKGFIDRYDLLEDGNVRIADYKTGKTPAKSWVGDKFVQLRIYAALMGQSMANVTQLRLLYLKDGVSFTFDVTDESINETVSYVQETFNMIQKSCETGDFPFSRSRLCDFCAYKSICPGWRK
jgi:putative RecB family exonuclease